MSVGFLEGATYPDGTSVAMVAAIQNFGAPAAGIPARPFFSNMVKDKAPEWGDGVAQALEASDNDSARALAIVGEGIKGQLQEAIASYSAGPPLKPATVRRKGFDKQLVDTGHMLNSVGYEVKS